MSCSLKELKTILEKEITKSSKVFIIGHNHPDCDSIGSAIGLYSLATHFNKTAYIIVDDEVTSLEPRVKRILDETKDNINYIKKSDYKRLATKKSLLITTDVNKKDRISIGDSLDRVNNIIIIDHHSESEDTIETDKKFNSFDVSSASEVVAKVLIDLKVKFKKDVANYLLAGINLDTKRFKEKTTSETYNIAKKLLTKGASIDYVNNLFLEEFESYARISNLIINGTIIKKYSDSLLAPIQVSFTINRNSPKTIYRIEDYAKAADKMLGFIGIDASFALGYVDEKTIHISARGGRKVNVGDIMSELNGGGNNQSAGGRIISDNIFDVEEQLMSKIQFGLSKEIIISDEPKIIKVKQITKPKLS